MQGKKILVTGPTGQVAGPVALTLAKDNEVWATARFSEPAKKAPFEQAGIRCVPSNLETGDFSQIPQDFDYVLNFAVARTPDFETDLKANGEGVGLLMLAGAHSLVHFVALVIACYTLSRIAQATLAQRKGSTPAQIALAWLLAQKPWIVPIPGTTVVAHMVENSGSAVVRFTPDEVAELNAAVRAIEIQGQRLPDQVLALSGVEAAPLP